MWLSSLLLSTCLIPEILAQDPTCHVLGECTGVYVDASNKETYNHCLEHCGENSLCSWITFYEEDKICVHWYGCPEIDTGCVNCYSGEADCPPSLPVCDTVGTCFGHVVDIKVTGSVTECLEFCHSVPECGWYTYYADDRNCVLTEDCVFFDESCRSCLSGERQCQIQTGMSSLFVVGGGTSPANSAEVVDLSGDDSLACPSSIPDFTLASYGSVGTYIQNQAMVCGGYDEVAFDRKSDCQIFDAETNSWLPSDYSMSEERSRAAAVQISPTQWWVTGGGQNPGGDSTMTTEMFVPGQGFVPYVDLPEPRLEHELVAVNSTHVVLLGGWSSTNKAWLFNLEAEAWTSMPELPVAISNSHAGLVTYPDGRSELVVTAGYESMVTQIFSFETNTWRMGTSFPGVAHAYGSSVPFGDTFLVVGGNDGSGSSDSIFAFNVDTQDWDVLPQEMEDGRSVAAAFLVPGDFVTCSSEI